MHAVKSVRTACGDATSTEALHQVLVHLSGPDGSGSLYNTAARGLHLASKQHQASARFTLRHLRLDRYHKGIVSAHGFTCDLTATVDWDLLQAFPGVTSWTLHPAQLASFKDCLDPVVAAAAGQLRRLEVKGLDCTSEAQLQGTGHLLWACRQLEEADITAAAWGSFQPLYLLLDPNSTSLATAKAPPAPLRSWVSYGIPYSLLDHWAGQQQQQQLGSTLTYLSMKGAGFIGDMRKLARLRGLKELTMGGTWSAPPALPSSMTHLTKLQLLGPPAGQAAVEAVCALTNLQHLSLTAAAAVGELPDSLASLKQLTCLVVSSSALQELPEDLGVWLPRLERLEAGSCKLEAVPTSLTRLTHLDLSSNTAERLALPTTLTRLKELVLSKGSFKRMSGVSSLTALELLDVSETAAVSSLTLLQPLTRLRHLNLQGVTGCDPASFTALKALKQLTHLNLACTARGDGPKASCCSALASTDPLPALQQLNVSHQHVSCTAALAPWVARLTALTWLNLAGSGVGYKEQLQYLPPQLQELDLSSMPLSGVPRGIQQLSGLRVLHLFHNSEVCQLPAWLSQLQRLEVLDLYGTGVSTEQQVLAAMPALRCVRVVPWAVSKVYGAAAHLHFGHSGGAGLGHASWERRS